MKSKRRRQDAPGTEAIDPYDPRRASKWGYDDAEIGVVIPGLQPTPAEEGALGPKYPQIHVRLVGGDGNAYAVLGKVLNALRQAGVSEVERDAFKQEATAGDYNHLLAVVMSWVEVD